MALFCSMKINTVLGGVGGWVSLIRSYGVLIKLSEMEENPEAFLSKIEAFRGPSHKLFLVCHRSIRALYKTMLTDFTFILADMSSLISVLTTNVCGGV